MKTISYLITALHAACAVAFCLTVAGLGLYIFEEDRKPGRMAPVGSGKRKRR